MRIGLARGMPAVSAEFIDSESRTVLRTMLFSGWNDRGILIDESQSRFIRIYLPSGEIATLPVPPSSNRWEIAQKELDRALGRLEADDVRISPRSLGRSDLMGKTNDFPLGDELDEWELYTDWIQARRSVFVATLNPPPFLNVEFTAAHLAFGNLEVRPISGGFTVERSFPNPEVFEPLVATLFSSDTHVEILIPGNVPRFTVRFVAQEGGAPSIALELEGSNPLSSAILSFLHRGDIHSAASMTSWAESAEGLIKDKTADPFAAAIGGYHLLRLHRFNQLHDWPRNLANWFPYVSDGCVIWARQLIEQGLARRGECLSYLLMAVERGLPCYTEGLRLLLDTLARFGDEPSAQAAYLALVEGGSADWESPVTTLVRSRGPEGAPRVIVRYVRSRT